MEKAKFALLGLGALALIGCFLPFSSAGGSYVSIVHMKGMSYSMFLVAGIFIALSIINLYKKGVPYMSLWFNIVSAVLIIGAVILGNTAKNHLRAIIEMEVQQWEFKQNFEANKKKFERDFKAGWEGQEVKEEPQEEVPDRSQLNIPKPQTGIGVYLLVVSGLASLALSFALKQLEPVSEQSSLVSPEAPGEGE